MLNRISLKERAGKSVLIGEMHEITHSRIISCLGKMFSPNYNPYSLDEWSGAYEIMHIPNKGIRLKMFYIPKYTI